MLQFWSDVPQVLQPLLSMPAVVDYIAVCENIFYNGVLLALLPNVFASQNLVEIRSLRRLARDWLPWCLEVGWCKERETRETRRSDDYILLQSCAPLPLPLSEGRMAVARLFSATLQRQTSLNHLAEVWKEG